jgi:hypothetical protein
MTLSVNHIPSEEKMNSRSVLFILLVAGMLVIAACGAAAPAETEEPSQYLVEPTMFAREPVSKIAEGVVVPESSDAFLLPAPTMAPAFEIVNSSGDLTVIERANRMIVKNADVRLMVKDTDVAIDRTTQIVGDAGGYIVSSRVWYQDYYGNSLKYASITLGVPADEFERVLTRLRGLAVRVLDETASGDDVTEQYVDLQSQLTNLEATRERIKEFLKDAKTVDEALRVNQELANIEAQIEQIKGRMNYLSDRSAFSTITVSLEPEFPVLTPTPTSTPKPTATPIPWKPGDTFDDAKNTVTIAYQGIANFLIWVFVVILPIVLPPALIVWGMWKLLNRKPGKPVSGD